MPENVYTQLPGARSRAQLRRHREGGPRPPSPFRRSHGAHLVGSTERDGSCTCVRLGTTVLLLGNA